MIKFKGLSKSYISNAETLEIFKNVNFHLTAGKIVALKGRSGSGKSTLLKILAGLDINYEGDYSFLEEKLNKNTKSMADFRLKNIGIVTQNYNLLMDRNSFENIALPLKLMKYDNHTIKEKVNEIIHLFGIEHFIHKYPNDLSGGQCQLVSMARALIKSPKIIIADEPTGALDIKSEKKVLDLLKNMSNQERIIIIATHSNTVSDMCDDIFDIKDFKIYKR